MLNKAKNIFIIGIKGVAMANLAVILKKMGKIVTGSDLEEEFITDELLKKNNISYNIGFKPESFTRGTDLIIYSAAHGGTNNPLAVEAKKRNIPVVSQAEILGELMKQFKTTIAVAGCHGKTTTSSLLSYALIQLGAKPSYLVGAPSFNTYDGGDYKDKKYFIVEADEYGVNPPTDLRAKFHFLNPNYIICTNIDFDHPDVYKNLAETKKSFLEFFKKVVRSHPKGDQNRIVTKPLIICIDDANLYRSIDKSIQDHCITYGLNHKADYRIKNIRTNENGTTFEVAHNSAAIPFSISLFGEKNVLNATAVIVMLLTLGFSTDEVKKAIQNFRGAKRRFEKIFEDEDFVLVDDYAHHPNEIEATILAARKRFPSRRIIVIFQPHTYSRTQMFLKDFAKALSLADYSYILPIFPSAREDKSKFSVTSEDIIRAGAKNCETFFTNNELILKLQSRLKKNDVIFTIGAGDVYKLKNEIIKLL